MGPTRPSLQGQDQVKLGGLTEIWADLPREQKVASSGSSYGVAQVLIIRTILGSPIVGNSHCSLTQLDNKSLKKDCDCRTACADCFVQDCSMQGQHVPLWGGC